MIVVIDDENLSVGSLIEEIIALGEEVIYLASARKAVAYIDEMADERYAFVIDVMMDAAGVFEESKTRGGKLTGLFLYAEIRARHKTAPVFLLTNLDEDELGTGIYADRNLEVRLKTETFYDDLANEVVRRYRA